MKESFERWGAVGGIVENHVIVCGGKSRLGGRHQNCSIITGSDLFRELKMKEKRYAASAISVNKTTLWIAGYCLQ